MPSRFISYLLICGTVAALASVGVDQACSALGEELVDDRCHESMEVSLLQTSLSVGKVETGLTQQKGQVDSAAAARLVHQDKPVIDQTTALFQDRAMVHAVMVAAARALPKLGPGEDNFGVLAFVVVGLLVSLGLLVAIRFPELFTGKQAEGTSEKTGPSATTGNGPTGEVAPIKTVLFFVIGHSISASSLTVINKAAMNAFHPPGVVPGKDAASYMWTLVFIQFAVSAIVAKVIGITGLSKCDKLEWKKAVAYFPAAGMFMISIIAGNAVMNYSSVSSFLVLRSTVPIPCAFLEMGIYGDPAPPLRTWGCLGFVVAGAVVYGTSMGGFVLTAVAWAVVFIVVMPVDGLLIKQAISSSSLTSWGLVYYNNTLACLPLIFYVAVFELPNMQAFHDMIIALSSPGAAGIVAVSCLVGLCLSYFQMTTRYYISATGFMVLGVVNKFLTVLWNEVFIHRDSMGALFGVLLTLSGAVAWQLTMGANSVQVRKKVESSTRTQVLAFAATIASLAAAAYVQHSITGATSHH